MTRRSPSWSDPEIDDLFAKDPELRALAHRIRVARPDPIPDEGFRASLRAKLVREAGSRPVRRGLRWPISTGHLVWSVASFGTALAAAAAVILFTSHPETQQTFAFHSPVDAQHRVSPDDVITVAFNQPMNHDAVVAGLHIEPATAVSTAWQGNNLVITPVHHLAANTPYSVTIAQTSLQTTTGVTATADLHITFGTAATPQASPSATPSGPATLVTASLGHASSGNRLAFAPNGDLVASAAVIPTPVASPTPSPTPPSSPSPSISGSPAPGPSTVDLASPPHPLGPASGSLAYAPGGQQLARLIPHDQSGSADIVVSRIDGSAATVLATTDRSDSPIAWRDASTIVFASRSHLSSVNLQRTVQDLIPIAALQTVVLAPDGRHAFLSAGPTATPSDSATASPSPLAPPSPPSSPAGVNRTGLVALGDGSTQALDGATAVGFSPDGSRVAWTDSQRPPVLHVAHADDPAAASATPLATFADGDWVGALALSSDGTRVAYDHEARSANGKSAGSIGIIDVTTGRRLAVYLEAGGTQLLLSGAGDRLAFVDPTGTVELAVVPGPAPTLTPITVPDGATAVLDQFVTAQVSGDRSTLARLGPNVDLSRATPPGISRSAVISVSGTATVTARVRLVADPSAQHPSASSADETVVLAPSNGTYLVTQLTVGPLSDEPPGPHIVSVRTAGRDVTTLLVAVDSDLDPTSVAGAITVTRRDGGTVAVAAGYDAGSRTIQIQLGGAPTSGLALTVSTALTDINGQHLLTAFTTSLAG